MNAPRGSLSSTLRLVRNLPLRSLHGVYYSTMAEVPAPLKSSPDQLHQELLSFKISKPLQADTNARLGRLSFHGRSPIETPHYIAISSRGCVPHLTQDTMREQTFIKAIYTGLEDCMISCCQTLCESMLTLSSNGLGRHRTTTQTTCRLRHSLPTYRLPTATIHCSPTRCSTCYGAAEIASYSYAGVE